MKQLNKRTKNDTLYEQLAMERSSFLPVWRDILDHVRPTRAKFTITDVNNGERKNQKILNSTATYASRTGRAGMMSGVTSPARIWFELRAPDPALNEIQNVKVWLDIVGTRMNDMFIRSNLYTGLPVVYGDVMDIATAALFAEEDYESVMRFYPIPVGSYVISTNEKLKVDTFGREFRMTVRQLITKFGYNNPQKPTEIDWSVFSNQVKNLYDQGNVETWIDVRHMVRPNENYDPRKLESKYKRYLSCYYEKGTSSSDNSGYFGDDDSKVLSEKGYDLFPVLCPRWEVSGEDSWGTDCPGMTSIGDNRQLQKGEKLHLQGIEKMVKPPMVAPESMRTTKASQLPGDITYEPSDQRGGGFRAAHEVNFAIDHLDAKNQRVEYRIQRAYFEDLFLMLANSDRRQITAREIDERHEEKLLALGPVLEQLNQDLLDPLIDLAFYYMNKQGLIPPPPEELQGAALKVEYVSIMAQAQKLAGVSSIERFTNFVINYAATSGDTSVLDKVNADQMVDVYGETLSVKAGIIRSDDEVAEIRAVRARAQQQQAQAEQLAASAGAAKQLSETNLQGDNALTRMIDQASAV